MPQTPLPQTPLTCDDVADDLTSFCDHTLSSDRREMVAIHLLSCPACTATVGQLRHVRTLVSSSSPVTAPEALSRKLAAIGGADRATPLWLAAGRGDTMLPSPRAERRRRVRSAAAGLLSMLVVLAVLGLVLSPDPEEVTDASGRANAEFDLATSSGPSGGAVSAVVALQPTTSFAIASTAAGVATVTADTHWHGVTPEMAGGLLIAAAMPSVDYSGTEQVVLAGAGGFLTATVHVWQTRGGPISMDVLDRRGVQVWRGLATSGLAADALLPATANSFRLGTGIIVCGHAAVVLDALRPDGSTMQRWWLATDLGLVLATTTLDAHGRLVRSVGFTQLTIGADASPSSPGSLTLTPTTTVIDEPTGPACADGFTCRTSLGGLPVTAMTANSASEPTMTHTVFQRGATVISVVQRRGVLAARQSASWGVGDDRTVLVWQSGEVVYTVTTNGGADLAQQAAAQLPHEPAVHPNVGQRIGAGLKRMFGSRGR